MALEEIELLERALLRLGNADTDDELESNVGKFLAPVLLKITSPHEAVRRKVMEVLTHLNRRLKSRPAVQLPVAVLLDQYGSNDSLFLRNFAIIYICMGYPRLTVAEQSELAPKLLDCMESKPETHQDKLLLLVLPLLGSIKIPDDPAKRAELLNLEQKPTTKRQLLQLLQDVLLLPYGITQESEVPAGFSAYSFRRIVACKWSAEQLEQLKQGICRFVCAGVLSDRDAAVLLVLTSADTRFSVATPAIAELGKMGSALDWTDARMFAPFYTLCLGTVVPSSSSLNVSVTAAERQASACSLRVRQKLLAFLLKSRGAGLNVARGMQLIFDSLFGLHVNQKCKVLALQFAERMVRDGQRATIEQVAKIILGGIVRLITRTSSEPLDVQMAAYRAFAQLARTCPGHVNQNLQLLVDLFEHMTVATPELQVAVREALVAMAPAFKWTFGRVEAIGIGARGLSAEQSLAFQPNANQTMLLALLSQYVESDQMIAQNVASVYLNTCYPDHFVPARYMLLLLLTGEHSALCECVRTCLYGASKADNVNYAYIASASDLESVRALRNDWNQLTAEQWRIVLPEFPAMVRHVHEQAAKREAGSAVKHSYGNVRLPYSYEVYTEILRYLRLTLWFSAGARAEPGDAKSVHLLRAYVRQSDANAALIAEQYLHLMKCILRARRGRTEVSCLYDLLNVAPERFAPLCLDLLDSFEAGLTDVSDDTRTLVAQVQGVLLAYGLPDDAAFEARVDEMRVTLAQKSLEHRHGCVLTLAHAYRRRIERLRGDALERTPETEQRIGQTIAQWKGLKSTTLMLVQLLGEKQPLLVSAGIKGLSLIGSAAALVLPDADVEPMEVDGSPAAEPSKRQLADTCVRLLRSAHTKAKTREEAAMCLGQLAIGDGAFFAPVNLKHFGGLLKLTKDTALNIAIAQGIVWTLLGRDVDDGVERSDALGNPHCSETMVSDFVQQVIAIVPDPSPSSRAASAIWLLAIVKNLQRHVAVYGRKQLLQYAFTELLSDDSEFVQDVASRGLGLVFGLSNASGQSDLAASLLDQLLGGKRQVKQVNEDSEIFEQGVLGKTPMGGNISTYKELCALASDLNQPEMIYQFMQLANHNAAWNSKLGAAFGLQSISVAAKAQMQPYLGKIVPRLFRYKYDPTPKIQNSMISIWDSVVSEPKETVERFYWEIFEELCANLTHVEWRVRIACCLAVRDLIKRPTGLRLRYDDRVREAVRSGVPAADAAAFGEPMCIDGEEHRVPEPDLVQLWTQLFRVMDDVHEGTRLAAEGSARALSKVCVLAAASNAGKAGDAVAASILPLILDTGVTHKVAEVRDISMRTLSELIDTSGALLTPHLPKLVPCLLRATGELELQKLSYLSTRLAANSEAQEAVDSVRAEAAKQHHSMETLSKCVRHMEYASFERIVPEWLELWRGTVNMGTKVASAHFVCLIALRFGAEMQPIVGRLLGACVHGLQDRNAVVRKYHASAIGHLIGLAREQSVQRLFAKLSELYFAAQDNRGVPQTIQAISKRQQHIVGDYAADVLPLVFFAMHEQRTDENGDVVDLWTDLWAECSPGDAGIRMHLATIVPMLERTLGDQSWLVKAQAANAIDTLAKRLRERLPNDVRRRLCAMLLDGLAGRTFAGKERLLQALASLSRDLRTANASAEQAAADAELARRLIDAVMRECRKEEPLYRTHALRAIGDILEQTAEDRFEELYNMIWYLMDKRDLAAVTGDDDDKAVSADERNRRAVIVVTLKEVVCETLGKAWPSHAPETKAKYQRQFVERCVQCLRSNTRPVQLSLMVALGKFVDRLDRSEDVQTAPKSPDHPNEKRARSVSDDEQLQQICRDVLSAIVYVAGISHTALKKEALSVMLSLAKKLIDQRNTGELALLRDTFVQVQDQLQKDSAPEIKCRLRDIEDALHAAANLLPKKQ